MQLSPVCVGDSIGKFQGTLQRDPVHDLCASCLAWFGTMGIEVRVVKLSFDELLRRLDARVSELPLREYRETLFQLLTEWGWTKEEFLEALSKNIGSRMVMQANAQ
jgi:hypothetical protein